MVGLCHLLCVCRKRSKPVTNGMLSSDDVARIVKEHEKENKEKRIAKVERLNNYLNNIQCSKC